MTRPRFHARHVALIVAGASLLLLSGWMPVVWYDALPSNPDVPAPAFKGVSLLRLVLLLEGVLLVALGFARVSFARLAPRLRLHVEEPARPKSEIDAPTARRTLAAITALALALRCIELDSDFWIDEVRATLDARSMSALEVYASYIRSNLHMLNTLLMKLSFAAFGEAEWSARLPVVVFGTATVPALYWVARSAVSREVALGAAVLLAASYHHILFSQNARGYVPYVFFSLVSTGLLVRALRDDRLSTWTLYVLTMLCNFAAILISGFVFGAHILVGAAAVVVVARRGDRWWPLLRRLLAAFGITGVLGFHLYSVQLPQVIAYVGATYASTSAGYWLFSMEFVYEVARGLAAGFGPGLVLGALPFLALAMTGLAVFFRRNCTLASALVLPIVLTALLLFVRDLTVSPRFFVLALPLAMLTGALSVELVIDFAARRLGWRRKGRLTAMVAVFGVFLAGSAVALADYYKTPLQPYRAALAHAAALRPEGGVVVAVHTAHRGCTYYADSAGLRAGVDLLPATSMTEFDAVTAADEDVIVITSMRRALRIEHPSLDDRIQGSWRIDRTFPAIIGDGQISVWLPR